MEALYLTYKKYIGTRKNIRHSQVMYINIYMTMIYNHYAGSKYMANDKVLHF